MRKLYAAAVALLVALACFIVASPPASAFGSEVLGCSFDSSAWTANSCEDGGDGLPHVVHFSAHNLSGTYTMSWTASVSNCSSTLTINCVSAGCTSTSTTCDLKVHDGHAIKTFTVNLKLTQSGQTRTISASAVVDPNNDCIRC